MSDDATRQSDDEFAVSDTLEIPAQFLKALANDQVANDAFDRLPGGDQRAFIDWVVAAKTDETRSERSEQAIEKLRQGVKPTD
jgi:uncharacterized protein YdeI (YjbR/CyaY-like superfamily)